MQYPLECMALPIHGVLAKPYSNIGVFASAVRNDLLGSSARLALVRVCCCAVYAAARVFVTHPIPTLGLGVVGVCDDEYPTLRLCYLVALPDHDRSTSAPGQLVNGGGDRTLVGRRGRRLEQEPGLDGRAVSGHWPWAASCPRHYYQCLDACRRSYTLGKGVGRGSRALPL